MRTIMFLHTHIVKPEGKETLIFEAALDMVTLIDHAHRGILSDADVRVGSPLCGTPCSLSPFKLKSWRTAGQIHNFALIFNLDAYPITAQIKSQDGVEKLARWLQCRMPTSHFMTYESTS
jgi:hypothetical protein